MDDIKVTVLYGVSEIQTRPILREDGALGYESRRIDKDSDGAIVYVGDWSPPLCWLTHHEPEPAPSLGRRLLNWLAA
jgi:hypothetical protein